VRHFSSATTCVVERQWLRVVYRHALATYLLGTVHCICQVSHPISARTVGTVAMVYVGYASGRLTLSTSMMIKKSLLHFFFEVRFLVSIPHFHLIPKSLSPSSWSREAPSWAKQGRLGSVTTTLFHPQERRSATKQVSYTTIHSCLSPRFLFIHKRLLSIPCA
jgi:hypothetical protein